MFNELSKMEQYDVEGGYNCIPEKDILPIRVGIIESKFPSKQKHILPVLPLVIHK